jgi:hypothetical protein
MSEWMIDFGLLWNDMSIENLESERLQQEIENLVNLRHPCIVCSIGFVLPSQS